MTDRRRTTWLAVALSGAALAGCTPPPAPPPPAPPPPAAETGLERRPIPPSGVHVVAPGETLSEIAYIYRLDTHALARANGIGDVHHVVAGRRLALRWTDPPTVGAPPARAAEARAIAGLTPGGGPEPLRVIVTPRETEAEGEAAPADHAAVDPAREPAAPAGDARVEAADGVAAAAEDAAAEESEAAAAPPAHGAAADAAEPAPPAEHAAAEDADEPAATGPPAPAGD